MPRLPGAEDLGQAPSGRSGRPVATYDATAIGRGVAQLGAGIASLGEDLGAVERTQKATVDKAEAFETQRRFLEFSAAQDDALIKAGDSAQPGAFGFREAYQAEYQKAAKRFFATVPEALKGEYDGKLFQIEDQLSGKALTFERTQRKSYYSNAVTDGLTKIENDLYANPKNFDRNLAEGNRFIDNLPDADVSPIEKDALRRDWKKKAQLASLNGMAPAARLAAVGAAPSGVGGRGPELTRAMPGTIRATISEAAQRYGVDPHALLVVARLESSGNPNAKNPNSSAGGLFQFTDGTARQYGLRNKFDAAEASDAAARLMRDNTAALRAALGREPTAGELYLAHQQGAGGAAKLLTNPNARAADLVGADAVRLNGGSADMTAGQFASMWTGKAGDVAAGVIDPRFADMPYVDREKVIAGAQADIAKANEVAQTQAKASYTILKDSMTLGVETGDVKAEAEILGSPLDDGDKAALLKALRAKNKEGTDVRDLVGAIVAGDASASVNPFDVDEKKVGDKAYDAMVKAVPAEQHGVVTESFVRATGYIPKNVQADLRLGATANDVPTLASALSRADAVETMAPVSFDAIEGGKALRDRLAMFRHFVNDLGMSGQDAAQRILTLEKPESKVNREVLKTEAAKFTKGLSVSDVTDAFDPSIWTPEPGAGLMPAQASGLLAEYREAAEDAYYQTGGDEEAAKALALADIKRRWNVTNISGEPQMMRLPPEMYYPALNGEQGYLRDDAMKTASEYVADAFPGRKVENVALLASKETRADIEMGRPPRYRLFYQYTEDGQTKFDEVFAGLWGMEASDLQGRVKADKEAARQKFLDQRQTIQRTNEGVQREVGTGLSNNPLMQEDPAALEAQQTGKAFGSGIPLTGGR